MGRTWTPVFVYLSVSQVFASLKVYILNDLRERGQCSESPNGICFAVKIIDIKRLGVGDSDVGKSVGTHEKTPPRGSG